MHYCAGTSAVNAFCLGCIQKGVKPDDQTAPKDACNRRGNSACGQSSLSDLSKHSRVIVLHLWNTPKTSLVPPTSTPNFFCFSFQQNPSSLCPLSSLPGSHLIPAGKTRFGHTSRSHQGHGPERLECHWIRDRTDSQTGSAPGPGTQCCHTVDTQLWLSAAIITSTDTYPDTLQRKRNMF